MTSSCSGAWGGGTKQIINDVNLFTLERNIELLRLLELSESERCVSARLF